MNVKDFLYEGYMVNNIDAGESIIRISFEHADKTLIITGESDCCDYNWFEYNDCSTQEKADPNLLLGCKIISIEEGDMEDVSDEPSNVKIRFPVTIKYGNIILDELRDKSELWKNMNKDIFDKIKSDLSGEYKFYRYNESNGYYQGWLNVTVNTN